MEIPELSEIKHLLAVLKGRLKTGEEKMSNL